MKTKTNMFNPKIKDFLEENKDITVIGLFWAGYWRLYVIIFGVAFAITILSSLFE